MLRLAQIPLPFSLLPSPPPSLPPSHTSDLAIIATTAKILAQSRVRHNAGLTRARVVQRDDIVHAGVEEGGGGKEGVAFERHRSRCEHAAYGRSTVSERLVCSGGVVLRHEIGGIGECVGGVRIRVVEEACCWGHSPCIKD